jgi:glycogen synthase
MKILMFGWEFPPHISGGLGTACQGLTQGLVSHGAKVLFVVPKAFGDESAEYMDLINASDVTVNMGSKTEQTLYEHVTRLEVGVNLFPYTDPQHYARLVAEVAERGTLTHDSIFAEIYKFQGGYGADLYKEVNRYAVIGAKLATEHDFDVIHAHDWLTYPAGIAAKMATGKPLVVHIHATEFDRAGESPNPDVAAIELRGLQAADRIIAVSHFTKSIVVRKYGIDPAKVDVVHNAVLPRDENTLPQYPRYVPEKIITFLGRITMQKGPDYFIEACHKVYLRYPNVRFVMAGNGDMLQKMIERVAELRMSKRFHFTGFLRGAEVDKMLGISDVYVMPSVSEPFGISPLEAMRANVPVVISKQSGVSEVLTNAMKVDFWDIDAMADAMFSLLQYPALSRTFIRNSPDDLSKLRWESAAFKVLEVYRFAMD